MCIDVGIILFLLDGPYYVMNNYSEVDITLHTTYTMIEPSQNIYKEGCLTDACIPGGHFYKIGSLGIFTEPLLLRGIRVSDCSNRDTVSISLSELGFITVDCAIITLPATEAEVCPTGRLYDYITYRLKLACSQLAYTQ